VYIPKEKKYATFISKLDGGGAQVSIEAAVCNLKDKSEITTSITLFPKMETLRAEFGC
jgi:hypothetical protein